MASLVVLGFLPTWVAEWFTPVWLLGLGCLVGLAAFGLLWLLLAVLSFVPGLSRVLGRPVRELPMTLREGPLMPILTVAGVLAVFGIAGFFYVKEPFRVLASLPRLPEASGPLVVERVIPSPDDPDQRDEDGHVKAHALEVDLERAEVRGLSIESNRNAIVSIKPGAEGMEEALQLLANEPYTWDPEDKLTISPFQTERIENLYVRNLGPGQAHVTLTIKRSLPFPEVSAIPITAVALFSVLLLYLLQRTFMPKVSAIALATVKSEVAQPLFLFILVVGAVLLTLFIWIPYNTFGEDIKVLKDSGLTLIMVLGIVQAIWAASTSIADEIEGRTALTVLSKPVGRRSFIVGKFLGIAWTLAIIFVVLSVWLLVVVGYKPIYDARENSLSQPGWQLLHLEMIRTVPGLVLAYMETLVLAALSVAISTRLPMLANFVICFAIYVLGHLTSAVVQSSGEGFEIVKFIGQLIATIFPNLDHFNIQAAVAAGRDVPLDYLGWAFLYCGIYSLIAMLLALIFFEDRDLA